MSRASKIGPAVLALGVLSIASAANATLIASENFSAPPDTLTGSLTSQPGSEGYGWGGNAYVENTNDGTVATAPASFASSLAYSNSNLTPSGTVAKMNGSSGSAFDFRQLGSNIATSAGTQAKPVVVYLSFLVQRQDTGVASTFLSLFGPSYNTGTYVNQDLLLNVGEGGGVGNWEVGVYTTTNHSGNNGTPTYYASGTLAGGSTYSPSAVTTNTTLLVLEMDYEGGSGNDSVELYEDPTGTTASTSQYTISATGLSLPAVGEGVDGIRIFSGSGTTTDYSNIAIGVSNTTGNFADVVPEPSMLAVLSLPALEILRRRRRAFGQ